MSFSGCLIGEGASQLEQERFRLHASEVFPRRFQLEDQPEEPCEFMSGKRFGCLKCFVHF